MSNPSHRKHNPNWPRRHGRRSRQVSHVPSFFTPEMLVVYRRIQRAHELFGMAAEDAADALWPPRSEKDTDT